MKAIMVMFDTLSRRYLSTYGNDWVKTPNFERLKQRSVQFDNFYAGSLPCMPARRELHTGRYNFLHRSWGPLEPFDVSVMECLKKQGIYTHISTDHSHYWEDGGATYLTRFNSWEGFRGQEGDRWVGMVDAQKKLDIPKQAKTTKAGESFYYNHASRQRMKNECEFSSVKAFQAGLDFISENHEQDNWFLQIESFDPHEPFYVPQVYLDMYEHLDDDVVFDWPSYAPVVESKEEKRQIMIRYAALITMCDTYLGNVLDHMDTYHLWDDTMLIVNTDHGFLMGEHEWWGKNVQPAYNEVVHLPCYVYDPRFKQAHGARQALCQSIDIAPTLLDFFNVEIPAVMQGKSLSSIVSDDKEIHKTALFGSFGGHINICDGRYLYMRSSVNSKNKPLFEYTLMPTRMRGFISLKDINQATLTNEFACFQDCNMMKVPGSSLMSSYRFGHKLFDLQEDPYQKHPIDNVELECSMLEKLRVSMIESEAPQEQYERIGIHKDCPLTIDEVLSQRKQRLLDEQNPITKELTKKEIAQVLMIKDMLPEGLQKAFLTQLETSMESDTTVLIETTTKIMFEKMGLPAGYLHMLMGMIAFADKTE